MIVDFASQGEEDLFNGLSTKAARKICPTQLAKKAVQKLDLLDSATNLADLRVPPGNHLEALTADRIGQHSIRINEQYRVCFIWTLTGPKNVEIVDYH